MNQRQTLVVVGFSTLIGLLLMAIGLVTFTPAPAQAQYLSVEAYPKGDLFICTGTVFNQTIKADAWTNVGDEIGTTWGYYNERPIGEDRALTYIKFGFGPSIMKVTNETTDVGSETTSYHETQDLGYLNYDIAFGLEVGQASWNCYTMWQESQHASIDDFWFSRNTVAFGDNPLGLFGHMKKSGDNPLEPFWGIYYDLGAIAPLSSNRLVLTFNLDPQDKADGSAADKIWTAWIMNF